MKLHILGGGPAGLGAGYFARKENIDFTIYEAANETGGNCRTFQVGDFKFDTGAHRFHDKDPEITKEILNLMGNEMDEISIPSYIFFNQKLIHFPLTPVNLFSNLDLKTLANGIIDVIKEKLITRRKVDNFRHFTYKKYGKTIGELFLINYSEKLWGVKADQLSIQIAGNRLKNLDIKAFIADTLKINKRAKHLEGAFFYPKQGFGRISKKVAETCGLENIKCNEKILKLTHNYNLITSIETSKGTIKDPDQVISSLPLKFLLENLIPEPPKEIIDIAKSLKFRNVILVIILLNKKTINNAATMYFPDKKFLFNRVYEPRNRSVHMSPDGKTSLVVEIPYFDGDLVEEWEEDNLKQKVIDQLVECNLFTRDDLIDSYTNKLRNAYPVLEKDFDEKVRILEDYLAKFSNLKMTGRNGRFVYSWFHNMMRFGKEIIDELKEKK